MNNVRNMVKRIGSEAETVADMEKLLLSETEAYAQFLANHSGDIKLYPETKIIDTYAIVGALNDRPIILIQKMIDDKLVSKYRLLPRL